MKNKLLMMRPYLIFLGYLLSVGIALGLIDYFTMINSNTISVLCIIFTIIIFIVYGFYSGRKALSKGYFSGIKTGLIYVAILFIIGLIFFGFNFNIQRFIYYMILILSSTVGSMIGINKKKNS